MSVRIVLPFLLLMFVRADQRYFRYEREITIAPTGQEKSHTQQQQTCVALDVDTFAHSASGLADLRIYRGTQETPYAMRVAAPIATEQASIQPLNLGSRDSSVVFDAGMPQGSYSSIQLDLQEKNFIATVEVSGSQSQDGNGATRLGTYTVFDLTDQKLGRSTVLHLPVSDFRYLHFKIKGPIKPEDVTGLSLEREPIRPAEYLTIAQSSQIMQQGRSSVIEFTVPAHVPVERIEFVPASTPANFSRGVSVGVTAEQNSKSQTQPENYHGEIRRIHSTYNRGLHTGLRIDDEQLSIEIGNSGTAAPSKWTVKIENGDDLPLPLIAVKLQMQKRTLCFDAQTSAAYTLYYGDPELTAPQYDYSSLFQPDNDAAQAALGPEQTNPKFEPRPDTRPFTEKHPALLWIALVIVVVVLGGIALRSARQVPRN